MTGRSSQKQQFFRGFERKVSREHGGDHARGRRKVRRPFDPKQALHVVLRSEKARGAQSMLSPRHCNVIRSQVERLQKRWDVAVYRYANVGNHLHLLLRARSRRAWQGFIRELAGAVAMIVTGARKGAGLERSGASHKDSTQPESAMRGFWNGLVYTRIVAWGKDFKNTARYVLFNLWEDAGVSVRKILARGFRGVGISEDGESFSALALPKKCLEHSECDRSRPQ